MNRGNELHTGNCLCGAVKYAVSCELNLILNCHCQFCRTAHGAEFVPVAMIANNALEILHGEELITKFEVKNVSAFRCFVRPVALDCTIIPQLPI